MPTRNKRPELDGIKPAKTRLTIRGTKRKREYRSWGMGCQTAVLDWFTARDLADKPAQARALRQIKKRVGVWDHRTTKTLNRDRGFTRQLEDRGDGEDWVLVVECGSESGATQWVKDAEGGKRSVPGARTRWRYVVIVYRNEDGVKQAKEPRVVRVSGRGGDGKVRSAVYARYVTPKKRKGNGEG